MVGALATAAADAPVDEAVRAEAQQEHQGPQPAALCLDIVDHLPGVLDDAAVRRNRDGGEEARRAADRERKTTRGWVDHPLPVGVRLPSGVRHPADAGSARVRPCTVRHYGAIAGGTASARKS